MLGCVLLIGHWKRIFDSVSKPYDENTLFTLNHLIQYNVVQNTALISEVATIAKGT